MQYSLFLSFQAQHSPRSRSYVDADGPPVSICPLQVDPGHQKDFERLDSKKSEKGRDPRKVFTRGGVVRGSLRWAICILGSTSGGTLSRSLSRAVRVGKTFS